MKSLPRRIMAWTLRLVYEDRAQDLIEYALMAGAVAVAAGAFMPPVANQISTIFSKVAALAESTPG